MTNVALRAVLCVAVSVVLAGCNSAGGLLPPNPFDNPLKKAVELYKQKKFVDAEVEAEKAVRNKVDYGFACTILAECLSEQGKFAEAEVAAREAVRYEKGVANSHAALARALIGVGPQFYQEAQLEAQAALNLPEATATPSSRAAQQTLLATAYQLQLKMPEAEAAYKEAIKTDETFAPAHIAYGSMLNAMNRYKEAEPELRRGIQLDDTSKVGWFGLVVALIEMGQYDEALKANERLAGLDPKDPLVSVLEATIYLKQDKLTQAEDLCRKAVKVNPNLGPAYTCLAQALYKQGRLQEAEAAAVKGTKLTPMDAMAYLTLARVLADQHKWPQAGFANMAAFNLSVFNKPLHNQVMELGKRIVANMPKLPIKKK